MSQLLILDFDGTLTEGEKESAEVTRRLKEATRERAWLDQQEFTKLFEAQMQKMRESPEEHGWKYREHFTAASGVDLLGEVRCACELMLEVTGAVPSPVERSNFFTEAFRQLTRYKEPIFKPEAWDTLLAIAETRIPHHIVSSSPPESVVERLRVLDNERGMLNALIDGVCGEARKYVIDPEFTKLEQHALTLPGLKRPMHLRRPHYYRVLDDLRQRYNTTWSEMVVVGDIFEMDLVLPFSLGATVAIMDSHRVPQYERDFANAHHPRIRILAHPGEIPTMLK